MEVVTHRREGLFPLPGEMKFDCDCPDWAGMCKHVAAVLYGVGARLDESPEMLFVLRGVNHAELVDVTAAITDAAKSGTSRRRIAASGIADVFGIDLAESAVDLTAEPHAPSGKGPEPGKPAKPATKSQNTGAAARRVRTGAAAGKSKTVANSPRADKVAVKKKAAPESTFPEPLTGDAIRAWRQALGETQAAFAARFKVSGATVSVWEKKGKAEVGMFSDTLASLRKAWRKTRRG